MTASRRGPGAVTTPPVEDTVIWHDVECGGYTADLPLWRELATARAGPVLELGAGTGRVTLDLAARGHDLTALDSAPALVRELDRRARERRLRVRTRVADARAFELRRAFALVIAPMQLVQLLGGAAGRCAMLAAAQRHLPRGGWLALALADPLEGASASEVLPPLPDVREVRGWAYSSRPVAIRDAGEAIAVERVREAVSPAGELLQSAATVTLDRVDPDGLAAAAEEAGLRPLERRRVPATDAYVGSEVLLLEGT